jgi:hypothetical protein
VLHSPRQEMIWFDQTMPGCKSISRHLPFCHL